MSKKKKVVIVGGGISGLATAYRLSELSRRTGQPLEITLVEAKPRLGGVIETKLQDGFLLEGGPDSFISEKPAGYELAKRLGITQEIIGTNNQFRRSFIYSQRKPGFFKRAFLAVHASFQRQDACGLSATKRRRIKFPWQLACRKIARSFDKKGKLIQVPEGFYLIAPSQIPAFLATPLLDWKTKMRMGCELFIPARKGGGDESVASFVRRRFGETLLHEVAQPMIGGIYTADPEFLSLEATMPQFFDLERQYGSVTRGLITRKKMRAKTSTQAASGPPSQSGRASSCSSGGPRYSLFLSFREGMETLVKKIVEQLPEVHFKLSSPIKEVKTSSGRWKIALQSGKDLEADAVCLSVSAPQAAQLLSGSTPELSRDLGNIPYESVATVNLAYKRADVPHKLDGFGFVVPAKARRKIVACSFSSVKFPGRAPQDTVLLRVFAGGALHREVYALEDRALERTVREELHHYLGIEKEPIFSSLNRYPQTMPQYQVGHLGLIRLIQYKLENYPGLYLAGNAYKGIGVPDCVKWGETTAEAMHQFLEEQERLPALEIP